MQMILKMRTEKHWRGAGVEFLEYNDIYEDVAKLTENQTVIYDGSALNYAILERMPESAKKIDEQNLTLLPKAIKNPVEVENIRQAHIKDGIALTKFMYWLKKNIGKIPMTEISAAEDGKLPAKSRKGILNRVLSRSKRIWCAWCHCALFCHTGNGCQAGTEGTASDGYRRPVYGRNNRLTRTFVLGN